MGQTTSLISALILILLNGFFVAIEFSLVKLRPTRVKTLVRRFGLRGRILGIVHQKLDAYLSTCQLGITLTSLALGWIGEPALTYVLSPLLKLFNIGNGAELYIVSAISAFVAISYLHIVLGELVPKSIAIRQSEKVSLWLATPLYIFYWLTYPAIWLLNKSANFVLYLTGFSTKPEREADYSTDELKLILRSRRNRKAELRHDSYSSEEWNNLAHSLDFSSMRVSDVMRPENEMIGLRNDLSFEENMDIIRRHRFSRYPLFSDETRREALGIIYLKDLFLAAHSGDLILRLEDYARPIKYVKPNTHALEVFRYFRRGAPHFILIGVKNHKPLGFLTLDNLLGVLVGQIQDEFIHSDVDWIAQEDGTFLGKGSLSVVSLERLLGIDIDEGRAESVGGLVINHLKDLPKEGQRLSFDGFDIVVKKMNGPKILLVRIYPKKANKKG